MFFVRSHMLAIWFAIIIFPSQQYISLNYPLKPARKQTTQRPIVVRKKTCVLKHGGRVRDFVTIPKWTIGLCNC